MTRAAVVTEILSTGGCDKETACLIVTELLSAISDAVAKGEAVTIDDFGTFYAKLRNQTTGRDIARNIEVIVPPRYIPFLRPYRKFSEQLNSAHACKSTKDAPTI